MKMPRRRRLESKTDYASRLSLLKSEKPRLIIRKTNRYIIVQIVSSEAAQDKVLVGINSKILLSKGLPKESSGSLKSLGAAYLTGFLLGKKALESGIKEAILDMGMYINVKNSRIYSALTGVLDSGLHVPHKKDVLPKMENIKSGKIAKVFDKIVGSK
ncbi:MAG TPA: 50S ribosomal protein L18 [Candidatus Nanoarchaeia archaeon]|nr:50S ribosomal protein L18 [Candidatus Nanoarchaeia archaeon]